MNDNNIVNLGDRRAPKAVTPAPEGSATRCLEDALKLNLTDVVVVAYDAEGNLTLFSSDMTTPERYRMLGQAHALELEIGE